MIEWHFLHKLGWEHDSWNNIIYFLRSSRVIPYTHCSVDAGRIMYYPIIKVTRGVFQGLFEFSQFVV